MAANSSTSSQTCAARRMPGPERRRQLLSTARKYFAEHGFHNTTMEDIADAAQVTKPVLYQHFKGKNELYAAVMDSGIELFEHQVITPLLQDVDNQSRARLMISNFLDVVIEDQDTYRIIFESDMRGDPDIAAKIAGMISRVAQRMSRSFQENSELKPAESDFISETLVGLVIAASHIVSRSNDPDEQKRQQVLVFKLAWGGIAKLDEDWA